MATIEEAIQELQERQLTLEEEITRIRRRSRNLPIAHPLGSAVDLDDWGSVKTHLDFEEAPLTPVNPPASVLRAFVKTVADTTGLTLLESNGKQVIIPRHVFARKPDDESLNTNTTLQNDDDLFVDLDTNETWIFQAHLVVSGPQEPGDIKLAFTVPSGSTLRWSFMGLEIAATSVEGNLREATIDGSGSSVNAHTLFNVQSPIFIKGTVLTSTTAGNLQLQWAQRSSDGSNTTIHGQSWLWATRIA